MRRFRGTVKNDVVVLEDGVHLPEGTEVEVRLPGRCKKDSIRRVLNNPITRFIGIDEIIEEDKKERGGQWGFGGSAEQ
jgi:hypothetical protein